MTPEQQKLLEEAQQYAEFLRKHFTREQILEHLGEMLGVSPTPGGSAQESYRKLYLEEGRKTFSLEGEKFRKGQVLSNGWEVAEVEVMPNGDQLLLIQDQVGHLIQIPATRLRREGIE